MIYTLSLNPAIDMTIITDAIKRDKVNQTELKSVSAGGKGFNASRALNCLHAPNMTIAFCGGAFSSNIEDMLDGENINAKLVSIEESIRVNIKMLEKGSGRVMEFNEKGPHVSGNEMDKLLALLKKSGDTGDYYIVSGSLPRDMDEGVYRKIISLLKQKKIRVLLDTSGDALRQGAEALPHIIKINSEEMHGLALKYDTGQDKLAHSLIKKGVAMIMVTDGPRDTFYYDIEGKYRIKSPDINGPYKTGCGDSVNAGLVYSLQEGFSLEKMLKFAVACGNANILNETPGMLDKAMVEKIADRVIVIKEHANE